MNNVIIKDIKEELLSVFKTVQSTDRLLEIAPLYCINGMGKSGENIREQCISVLEVLQEEKIFMTKNSCYIEAFCETDIQYKNIDYAVAFRDANGIFSSSLHKLIEKSILKKYAKYGIVSLYITDGGYFKRNKTAFQQLIQQIQLYRNHFLFLIFIDGKHDVWLREQLEMEFFCYSYQYEKSDVEEYYDYLTSQLEKYNIAVSEELQMCMKECLLKHYGLINENRIKQLIRQLVWENKKMMICDTTNLGKNESQNTLNFGSEYEIRKVFDIYFNKYKVQPEHRIGFENQ